MSIQSRKQAKPEKCGSLALELFVVTTTPVATPEKLKASLPERLAYQAEQEAAGSLVFAGPLTDPGGSEILGEGMIIYRAESLTAARRLSEADPMHAKGSDSLKSESGW